MLNKYIVLYCIYLAPWHMHAKRSARLSGIHWFIKVCIIDLNAYYNFESNQFYRAFQYLEAESDSRMINQHNRHL